MYLGSIQIKRTCVESWGFSSEVLQRHAWSGLGSECQNCEYYACHDFVYPVLIMDTGKEERTRRWI